MSAPLVKADLTGRVAIVTGANTGLGYEAVKHLATMGPAKVIMTARDERKGIEALRRVKEETGFDRIELGILDQASFESVKAFASKVIAENERLDLLLENAGVNVEDYVVTKDGYEESLQVNTIAPALLTFLLAPLMKQTSKANPGTPPRITIVSSTGHATTTLDETLIRAPSLFEQMTDKEYCARSVEQGSGPMAAFLPKTMMERRYNDVKLFNVFFALTLHTYASAASSTAPLIVNVVDPGWCHSDLLRNITGPRAALLAEASTAYAAPAEVGGAHIVYGLIGREEEVKGRYLNCGKAAPVGEFVGTETGRAVAARFWGEITDVCIKLDKNVEETIATLTK